MLERIKAELQERTSHHEELVKKYNETKAHKEQLDIELLSIEKEIIRNQGAIEAIDNLGYELIQKQEQEAVEAEPCQVEVIE